LVFVTKYRREVFTKEILNSLKGVSIRMIRKKLWGGALWSPSSFAGSCGGAPTEIIRQYIEQLRTPH
jgi:putative transposase